jgi:large subunit ribosomal protein L23
MAKKVTETVENGAVEEVKETKPAKKTVKSESKKTTKKSEGVKVGKATIKSYDCIIKPILSEETMKNMETMNKITVQVNKNSNKVEIKNAFEAIFGVKVKQVNISNVRAKDKRVGKYSGKTSSYKKAIITLAEGQSLDLLKN